MVRQLISFSTSLTSFFYFGTALLWLSPDLNAQLPKGNPKNLGVDSIKTSERQLYGFTLGMRADKSIDCAIDRKWLEATYPKVVAEMDANEDKTVQDLKQLRIDRLKAWIKDRDKDQYIRLKIYLEGQLETLEAFQPTTERSEFILLNIEPAKLVRLIPAKPENRRIAGVAFKHNIKDVTTTSTMVLERKLKELGVDPKNETFDLSTKLPKFVRESEKQWSIRQALVEHEVHEAVELQGTGNMLMGPEDRPDPMVLIKGMQSTQGLDMFRELAKEMRLDIGEKMQADEKEQWRKIAIEKAEKKNSRGVLVLRLQQNLYAGASKVSATFLVKGSDDKWFDVYHSEHENDGSKASSEELDKMRSDPTIQRLLPMIEALGGKEQIEFALRKGAATQLAMSEAREKFSEFKSTYSRDILSPPPPEPAAK
jgi:hypothetical protein